MNQYPAPGWLPGGHLQTIYAAKLASRPTVSYQRERWDTPDGDFIDVDYTTQADPDKPLLVLFHGLEGCSRSHYALALMAHAQACAWQGAVVHFRGCAGELNRAPRAYHSGDSNELDWILKRFAREHNKRQRFAAGVSLGGNALLKWAGESGNAGSQVVDATAAISAPHDLRAGAWALNKGLSRVYYWNFYRTLRSKSLAKLAQHPGLFDKQRLLAARNFFEFDDAVTAPMHGFDSCYDYWNKSSSRQFLGSIKVPTLVLNAVNDPFMPEKYLASASEASADVVLDYPGNGGHVGFITGQLPGSMDWLCERVFSWLSNGRSG